MDDIEENDCCGNGCANCILDVKSVKYASADTTGKQNILEKYTKFLLLNKSLHNSEVKNVWELHFKSKHCNDTNNIIIIYAGHHLMMRKVLTKRENLKNDNVTEKERKYLLRPYSPFWWNVIEMEFKILIELIPNGPMSEYIGNLQPNDEVEFRGPIGCFKHQIDTKGGKYLLVISQGIAITPVLPIIKEVIYNDDDMTRIVHIACFRDLNHVYFRDDLNSFSRFWNYKAHIFLSKELCNNTDCNKNSNCLQTCPNFKNKLQYNEIIKPYRLTENELIQILNNINYTKENTNVVISGNGSFQSCYMKLCGTVNNGFLKNSIHLL